MNNEHIKSAGQNYDVHAIYFERETIKYWTIQRLTL